MPGRRDCTRISPYWRRKPLRPRGPAEGQNVCGIIESRYRRRGGDGWISLTFAPASPSRARGLDPGRVPRFPAYCISRRRSASAYPSASSASSAQKVRRNRSPNAGRAADNGRASGPHAYDAGSRRSAGRRRGHGSRNECRRSAGRACEPAVRLLGTPTTTGSHRTGMASLPSTPGSAGSRFAG
jgi:hypothetical protein